MRDLKFPLNFNVEIDVGNGRLVQTSDKKVFFRPYPTFDSDHLTVYHKRADFLYEKNFMNAYKRGMDSGHKIMGGGDLHVEWRVHTCLWAARHAVNLDGDFVECGVNTGCYSLAIAHYLEFSNIKKQFFLFDTYNGVSIEQCTPAEAEARKKENYYDDCFEQAKKNFAAFPNCVLVRGRVPESLGSVQIDKVSYLSIDMNVAAPEIAAGEYFWPKLVSGAAIVLDDYGWSGHEDQKKQWNQFAYRYSVPILLLPTGQGLILKP
jgi:O-methyltransferase